MINSLYFILSLMLITLCVSAQNYNSNYYYNTGPQFVYDNSVKGHISSNISDRTLQYYKDADANGDGRISVQELQAFQNWLKRNFEYVEYSNARHPDDFIASGGGNCVGFSTMTTSMLNYHGVVAYVAGFGRVTTNKHALTIIQVKDKKASGYLFYTIRGWGIPAGYYIPVDYTKVGGLSAIDRRWKIARVFKPNLNR